MQTRVRSVSVSQVARRYDVNANMVFKWLRDPRFKPAEDDLPSSLLVEDLPEAAMADGRLRSQPLDRRAFHGGGPL